MRILSLCIVALALGCRTSPTQEVPTAQKGTTLPTAIHVDPLLPKALPRPVDTRTDAQIALAACERADGSWACPAIKRPLKAATISAGIPPASWSVPNWYFDPANTSTCASASNSCTSATCGGSGIGPCPTWAEIVNRWGTTAPRLSTSVTVTQLSDQTAPWADPIIVAPIYTNSAAAFTFNGTLIQVTTATIGTFTPRNRATALTNHITAVGQSGAYWTAFIGDLVNDTTAGAWFWIERDLGANTAQITEPINSSFNQSAFGAPTYVTIANGDVLTIYRQTKSAIMQVLSGGGAFAPITVQHVVFTGDSSAGVGVVLPQIGGLNAIESRFANGVLVLPADTSVHYFFNDYFDSNTQLPGVFWSGACAPDGFISLYGYSPTNRTNVNGDILIDCGGHISSNVGIGRAYLSTFLDTDQQFGAVMIGQFDGTWTYPDNELWGPGSWDARDQGLLICYGGCTSQLLLTGPLTLNEQDSGVPWNAATQTYGAPRLLTPANIDDAGGLFNPRTGTGIMNHP